MCISSSDSRSAHALMGGVVVLLTALLSSCAPPQVEEPDPTPTPAAAEPAATPSAPQATPTPVPGTAVVATPVPKPTFDPKAPDWQVRYQMLKEHYEEKYEAKKVVGQNMKIPLANGGVQEGIVREVGERSLMLDIANGSVELHAESMRDDAKKYFFKEYFAHLSAVEQARAEYRRWEQMQEAAQQPKPTATPYPRFVQQPMVPRTRPDQGDDGLTRTYRPDPDAKPPKNEGPAGRVWQVDSYLRRNSAVPHSLRYKKWFPVQKHGNGYKVRVQYSVESAGGLGTSNEDMMFFMHADGKVYQRAGVK